MARRYEVLKGDVKRADLLPQRRAEDLLLPGVWDLDTNAFSPVTGLPDPDILETSSSVLLPPAQDKKVMVLGGGGVGESAKAPRSWTWTTPGRPSGQAPAFQLPEKTRCLSSVILPDDTLFTTGGSRGYRGRGASDILRAQIDHPATNTFTRAAAPTVGRNYHTEALLLPDGRVAVFGSDPLFADKADSRPGRFEQRVEVFAPPYLHRDDRPRLEGVTSSTLPGGTLALRTPDVDRVTRIRLIRPGQATHVTDFDQRSIALDITGREADELTARVPRDRSLVPPGRYMVFAVDGRGVPSKARWVHVRQAR